MTQIFGIVPVKNEDIFIERVVSNIVDFCDDVLVLEVLQDLDFFVGIGDLLGRGHVEDLLHGVLFVGSGLEGDKLDDPEAPLA